MADNILRLKVESSEYDAKLKKAAEGVRHLADVAHKSAGDMTGLEQSTLDYIKSIGEMETKSRTAAGSVRELESTYKELKVIYDQLNDVEKADEGGKALAKSLEQLKQRAQDAKKSLDDASKSLQKNEDAAKQDSSTLEKLASKFTMNIDVLKLFDMGLKAAKAGLDVAKDAFMSSETNVDDWGRTVRSAEGTYQAFVQSLNTSDFTGFLSNIGRVTQAAQEAYNALDELGTRMTIINPERAKLQARQQELRADIRRNGADSEVGKAALAELKKIEPLLSKSFKTESQMNYTAFEKLVRERLAEGGINLNQKSFQQFMKTFSSDAAFQNLRRNARGSSELRETSEIGKFRTVDTRNTEQKLLDLFTDEWRQANSGYLTASFSAQGSAASNALGNARYLREKAGGTGVKGGNTQQQEQTEIQKNQKEINKLSEEYAKLGDKATEAARKRQEEIQKEIRGLEKRNNLLAIRAEQAQGRMLLNGKDVQMSGLSIRSGFGKTDEETVRDFDERYRKKTGSSTPQLSDKAMKSLNKNLEKQLKIDKKDADEERTGVDVMGQMNQGISSIVSGIEGLGIELPKGLHDMVAGIGSVLSVLQGITILVEGIAAMQKVGTFLGLGNGGIVPGLASGGLPHAAFGCVIPGTSFSGDNLYAGNAWVNSGELVLNRLQQGVLASELQGQGLKNMTLETFISGDSLRVVLNNSSNKWHRGNYVTSTRR